MMNENMIGNTVLQFPTQRICPHCHGQVDDDARFCKHCGNKLEIAKKEKYAPKTKRTKIPLKTIEEIRAMEEVLAKPTKDTPSKKRIADRNKMIFMLGICTGLRASDLVRLTPNHIDIPNKLLYIVEKKTGKGRLVNLSERLIAALTAYISKYDIKNDKFLFPSQKFGEPMTVLSLNDIIIDAAKSLGWDARFYGTHTMRKTYAYQFYTAANKLSKERGYRALSILCKELNHSSEAITLAYIGISQEEVCEICNISTEQYNEIFNSYIENDELEP